MHLAKGVKSFVFDNGVTRALPPEKIRSIMPADRPLKLADH